MKTAANRDRAKAACRRAVWATIAACVLAGAVAGCAETWKQGPDDPRLGGNCVRGMDHRPIARTINYVEPELCGRKVERRGPYHVRLAPMSTDGKVQEN